MAKKKTNVAKSQGAYIRIKCSACEGISEVPADTLDGALIVCPGCQAEVVFEA